jgi:hypothetical protein
VTAPDLDALRDRVGDLEAIAGARLVTLGDGAERGLRLVEMRSGGGLDLEIAVDRGLDIGRLALAGATLSWHSPTGLVPPWLIDRAGDRGQGFLRGFSGLLATCGLDHIRQPETAPVAGNPLHPSGAIDHPLHGDGTFLPARLAGYGLRRMGDGAELWCEGEMRQAIAQGDCLMLTRRITCPVGGTAVEIRDTVTNIGAVPSPHMLMYHLNFGYPLVDAGARLALPGGAPLWQRTPHDPLASFPAPAAEQRNELSTHRFGAPARCRLVNPANGLSVAIEVDGATMPYCQILRMPGRRVYLLAVEPCTTACRTRAEAAAAGELRVLAPGEAVRYRLRLEFSQGSVG